MFPPTSKWRHLCVSRTTELIPLSRKQIANHAAFHPLLPDVLRAEFDGFLKKKANLLGIPTLSTANQIFQLFDGAREGILHITDLAAGLAVLCDGNLAQSIRYSCRLYRGPDGDMGFLDIYGFALSIFKVRSFKPLMTHQHRRQRTIPATPIGVSLVAEVEIFMVRTAFNAMQRRKHDGTNRMFLL